MVAQLAADRSSGFGHPRILDEPHAIYRSLTKHIADTVAENRVEKELYISLLQYSFCARVFVQIHGPPAAISQCKVQSS
jgi:hypothetical protein